MRSRLVVFEMHHLGDSVMALPFLRTAMRTHDVTIICRPETAAFLGDAAPGLTVISAKSWPDAYGKTPRLGRGDLTACVWPDSRAHLAMKRTGAGRRIGFEVAACNFYGVARPWRRRRLLAGLLVEKILSFPVPLLTDSLKRTSGQTHGDDWTQLSRVLGMEPDFSFPWISLPPAPPDFDQFVALARAGGKKVLALHAGGRLPGKRWPIENFQSLLHGFLARPEFAVAIIKPPGEKSPDPCQPNQAVFQAVSIPSLAAIFAKADGVLCNDSLASHLAAAVGVPVATIFGSGDPAWFAPHGNAHLVISTEACPHRPCVDRCVMPSLVCLESVSIHLVEQKLSAMLADPFANPNRLSIK